jgi:RND family efflux transporter MFP subunit
MKKNTTKNTTKILISVLIAVAIIGGAVLAGKYLIDNTEKPHKKPPRVAVKRVNTVLATPSRYPLVVAATGVVTPRQKSEVIPEVSGKVTYVGENVVPGNLVQEGELLIKIDARQYKLAVAQRETELVKAEAALQSEQGSQDVARAEYKLLGKKLTDKNQDLVLRQPQLQIARANVNAAQAALEQAKLDLTRATLRAPISGIISSKNVDLGVRVAVTTSLLSIVDTGAFWIEAEVPTRFLRFIATGEEGSLVDVFPDSHNPEHISGRVLRVMPELDSSGLMGKVLVEVVDPMGLQAAHQQRPKLLINNHVSLKIHATTLDNVVVLPESLIRNNHFVWVYNPDNTLSIVKVHILHRIGQDIVVQADIAGKEIVITNISVPVEGMKLERIEGRKQP